MKPVKSKLANAVKVLAVTATVAFSVNATAVRVLRSSLSRNVGRIGASQREVLRMVTSEEGLTCNGSSLIEFSVERHADAVHEYLTSRS